MNHLSLRRATDRRRGVALLAVLAGMMMLLLIAGLAIETGRYAVERDRLQVAADAAARYAVADVWKGPNRVEKRARDSFKDNGVDDAETARTVEYGYYDLAARRFTKYASKQLDANAVRVTVTRRVPYVTPLVGGSHAVTSVSIARMPGLVLLSRFGDEDQLWQNDKDMLDVLKKRYDLPVRLLKGDETTAAELAHERLILISSTNTSHDLDPGLRDVRSGILNMETKFYDELKMTGPHAGWDYEGTIYRKQLYLAGRLAAAFGGRWPVDVEKDGDEAKVGWGRPTAAAEVLVAVDDDDRTAAAFEYEPGDAMYDGFAAPSWRSGIFTRTVELKYGRADDYEYSSAVWYLFDHMLDQIVSDDRWAPALVE